MLHMKYHVLKEQSKSAFSTSFLVSRAKVEKSYKAHMT